MKIAACWIVKDDGELDNLKNSVASVYPFVNSIHITANGEKVDKIKEWCKECGYDYSYLKWNKSFSEQRNFNFSRVPKDADWIWWQDADDVLVGGGEIRKVARMAESNKLDCVYFTYWYSCLFDGKPIYKNLVEVEIKHNRERLLRPGRFVWKKRCHENPIELPGLEIKHGTYFFDQKSQPIAVMHTSAQRIEILADQLKREKRNRELLELDLEDEVKETGKHDPRTILYLMKILKESQEKKDWERCIQYGYEYLDLSGWDMERNHAYMLMGRCEGNLNNWGTALDFFHLALREYSHNLNTYLSIANTYAKIGKYREAYEWLRFTGVFEDDKVSQQVDNYLENKMLAAETGMNIFFSWEGHKDFDKAYRFAKELYELQPTKENGKTLETIKSVGELNESCKNSDKLLQWMIANGYEKDVLGVLQRLPQAIQSQPFGLNYFKTYSKPRFWQADEICYFANFNGPHFEHWDGTSLDKGLGGSETAVIVLAELWVKMGYKVYVYGDPELPITVNGVSYLPWYYFNPKDKFNILIQWRSSFLANQVSSKKFYVDLHDIYSEVEHLDKLDQIDGFFVKSQYHRSLAPNIPDNKFIVISNGVL